MNFKATPAENFEYIASAVERAGGRAYFVGGCVRDGLLGKSPKDTDMKPTRLSGFCAGVSAWRLSGKVSGSGF